MHVDEHLAWMGSKGANVYSQAREGLVWVDKCSSSEGAVEDFGRSFGAWYCRFRFQALPGLAKDERSVGAKTSPTSRFREVYPR